METRQMTRTQITATADIEAHSKLGFYKEVLACVFVFTIALTFKASVS